MSTMRAKAASDRGQVRAHVAQQAHARASSRSSWAGRGRRRARLMPPRPPAPAAGGGGGRRRSRPRPGAPRGCPAPRSAPRAAPRSGRRSFTVDTRWETRKVVRERITSRSPSRMRSSVSVSTAERESSRTRIRGSRAMRAGQGGPLLLAAGEGDAALAHAGLVPVLESRPRPGRAGPPRPPPPRAPAARPPARPRPTFSRRVVGEQERLLGHEAHRGAQPGERDLAHVHPVHEDRARRGIVEPREQAHQGGLAGAGGPHDGHRLPRRHLEVDVVEDRAVAVGEGQVAEGHRAPQGRHRRAGPRRGSRARCRGWRGCGPGWPPRARRG